MRNFTAIALAGLLLVGCHSSTATGDAQNAISFTETNYSGQQVRQLSFVLTNEPAKTCIAGSWKKARVVHDANGYTKDPAYIVENRKIEVLLVNWACDAYDSYVGNLAHGTFQGEHVSYGLGHSRTIGKVSGVYPESKP